MSWGISQVQPIVPVTRQMKDGSQLGNAGWACRCSNFTRVVYNVVASFSQCPGRADTPSLQLAFSLHFFTDKARVDARAQKKVRVLESSPLQGVDIAESMKFWTSCILQQWTALLKHTTVVPLRGEPGAWGRGTQQPGSRNAQFRGVQIS